MVQSISQFLQQQGTESKEPGSQEVPDVTVRDVLDAIKVTMMTIGRLKSLRFL